MHIFFKTTLTIASILFVAFSFNANARDTKNQFSIADALSSPSFEGKLNPAIKLYFGDQLYPAPSSKQGEYDYSESTNVFGKSDISACENSLLSVLIRLQARAVKEGGNAVVNIRSYYKKNEFSSASHYECDAGRMMAGVGLIGDVVTLPE